MCAWFVCVWGRGYVIMLSVLRLFDYRSDRGMADELESI